MIQTTIHQEQALAQLLASTCNEVYGTCFIKRDNEILLNEDGEMQFTYRDEEEDLMDILINTDEQTNIEDGGFRLIDTIDLEQAFSDGVSLMISHGKLDMVLTNHNKLYHIIFDMANCGGGGI